jgi:dolichol-phosphate mannosyltransferase
MSGFFAMRRRTFLECVHGLSQQGYKVLLDIVASSRKDLKIVEVPYVFRARQQGESKLDALVMVEFGLLMADKASRGVLRPKLLMFLWVGCCGLIAHLAVLRLVQAAGVDFMDAQVAATIAAMTLNFAMNNALTYRAERLRGPALIGGYLMFCAICSLGAVANVSVASVAMARHAGWTVAGLAGAAMSAVYNFEVASRLVWGVGRQARARAARRRTELARAAALQLSAG